LLIVRGIDDADLFVCLGLIIRRSLSILTVHWCSGNYTENGGSIDGS
jgi:hypothetical protein